MTSIRRQLLTSTLIGVVAAVVVVGATTSWLIASRLRHDFDRSLIQQAGALASLVEIDPDGRIDFDFSDRLMPEFARGRQREFFEVWSADGERLEHSPSLDTGHLPAPRFDGGSHPRAVDCVLPDGRPGRLVQVAFSPNRENSTEETATAGAVDSSDGGRAPRLIVVVARDVGSLERSVAVVFGVYAAGAIVLTIAIGLMLRTIVTRGLRPLEHVANQIAQIGPRSLHQRLTVPRARELVPIVERGNALLTEVERAMERESRFAADVAHELRTPVAELKTLTDVARRWPDARAPSTQFVDDAHAIAVEMQRIVDQLLALARIEGGRVSRRSDRVDVRDLVDEELQAEAAKFVFHGDAGATDRPVVESDRSTLLLVVRNLLSNAARYAPPDSPIEIACARDGADSVRLDISNEAPELAPDDVPRMFERFWRKDAARSGGGHAGIGLALARSAAAMIGAQLNASLDRGVLTMSLRLPMHCGVGAPTLES